MADPYAALAARAAQGQSDSASEPAANDPYADLAARAAGQTFAVPAAPNVQAANGGASPGGNPLNAITGFVGQSLAGAAGAVAGGGRELWDLALGRGGTQALQDAANTQSDFAYHPVDQYDKAGAAAAGSDLNPANWVGIGIRAAGNEAVKLGAPAQDVALAQTALPVALAAVPFVRGVGGIMRTEPYTVAAEEAPAATSAPAAATNGPAPVDTAPIPGGVPKADEAARSAILERVGIPKAQQRVSAIQGDAKDAASDFQSSKLDEPGGQTMAAQLETEREALTGFTQNLIGRVGGSVGTDEEALAARGATIAKPFDDLRSWVKTRMGQLYDQGNAQSDELAAHGNPSAYTQLQGVDQQLSDPTFRNTLMAKDQGGLLSAVQAQLQHFRQTNPLGFTPKVSEQFRQWLNQVWTPQNSAAIGKLTSAVDNDVFSTGGGGLFNEARAVNVLKNNLLENPDGISGLFDHDPKTPINRSTKLEAIPQATMNLSAEQFGNLLTTLKGMPEELQPQAQAAIGEIKGQMLNRLLKAGTQTRSGRAAQVWHGQDVSTAIGQISAKLAMAFADDPDTLAQIKDLNSAGQILHVNEGYPGAYAQAANLSRRGLGGRLLPMAAKAAGATVGSVLGPVGQVVGALAGGAVGEAGASTVAEQAALRAMNKRIGVK